MKLVFFANYLNHHQVLVADELYRILSNDFCFIQTMPRNIEELKGGEDYSSRPYCLLASDSEDSHQQALILARESDICVFGACSQIFAVERAKNNSCSISFEIGERWLKRGALSTCSPVLRKWWWNYMRYYRKRPFYKLCASAFAANDDKLLGCYKERHFKWGYFTAVTDYLKLETCNKQLDEQPVRLMWCARFISWKHPELPVECIHRLKSKGYKVKLEMYGEGTLKKSIQDKVGRLQLNDCISLWGNKQNSEIQWAMRNSDIFLFTSDKQEGWGAVANEAMANGCAVVSSDAIGSTAYLIKDGVNGFYFKDQNVDDLTQKVARLIDNPDDRLKIQRRAYETMRDVWSPRNAAENLLRLIDDIRNGRETSILEGPCSKA